MAITGQELEDKIVAELRAKKVELWLPPYIHDDKSKTRGPNHAALNKLAESFMPSFPSCTKDEVIAALLSKQAHALEKLEKKKKASITVSCLDVIILGFPGDVPQDTVVESWAERVDFHPKALKLHSVNPKLKVSKFVEDLQALLKVSSVRLLHKGKAIPTATNDACLVQALCKDGNTSKGGLKTTIYCQVEQEKSASLVLTPEQTLIQSIRDAASKLSGDANIDVTDQNGKHVPMLPSDRRAFLTALGLARLGRARMDSGNYSSALTFLLQADQEWNSVSTDWHDRVDNYGLLQMDIAWSYLHLERSDTLPDATRRLQVAETVLRKQVHTNFITLAVTMADMGQQVPPLAAIFVRLFLLQGVAYHYSNNPTKAKEKLDWAWLVCRSLRNAASPEDVASLCEAMAGVTKSQAISALRRCSGDPNHAVELLEQDKANAIEQHKKLQEQRELGFCQNTTNYVDIDAVAKLQSVLGISSPHSVAAISQEMEHLNRQVAVGLMRLANNDLDKAIDIYQDVERNSDAVFQRVSELDRNLANHGLKTPKRSKKRARFVVDKMALAQLVSMGVEEPRAKQALRSSQNDVDASLLWLATRDDKKQHIRNDTLRASNEDEPMESASLSEGSLSDAASFDDGKSRDALNQEQLEFEEAINLLQRELGEAIQDRDMEKEYLGNTLDEEWGFLEQFGAGQSSN